MSKVVERFSDENGWSASVPNLSGKLKRSSLPQRALQSEPRHDLRKRHAKRTSVKWITFEAAIIERYRRESSVEEALIGYWAGVSVRRMEGITEALLAAK